MQTTAQKMQRVFQYGGAVVLKDCHGWIAWQVSTGENVEILFIEVNETRKGYGTDLIRKMCERIKPYNSVFVFRKAKNKDAGKFYRSLGFKETPVKGLYDGETAVLGTVNYKELCQILSR